MELASPRKRGFVRITVFALTFLLGVVGCAGSARFTLARTLYTSVDAADTALAAIVDETCTEGCHEADATCRQRCEEQADRLEPAVTAVETARRFVLGAIGALLAAEEDGDDPPELRERLSCAAASLILVVYAVDRLGLDMPEWLSIGINATLTYGGIARSQVFDRCPGLDDQQDPTHVRHERPAPTPTHEHEAP